MKRFSVVLVTLGVILISQPAFTNECDKKQSKQSCEYESERNKFATFENWKPFLPTDLVYTENDHRGKMCDKNGIHTEVKPVASCNPVYSPSTRTNYIVGRSHQHGDRIFIVKSKSPKLLVQFESGGGIMGSPVVVYASPEALEAARNRGYVMDKRNNTMVKIGDKQDSSTAPQSEPTTQSAPQTTNVADCASKTALLEKMKCIADSAATQK